MPPSSLKRRTPAAPVPAAAIAAITAIAGCSAWTASPAQMAAGCPQDPRRALEQVNAVRSGGAQCGAQRMAGAGALVWNERLREMAQAQATFLAENDELRHGGPNGQTVADRARSVGYPYARVAENLALGAIDVEHALRAWTASEKHCVNLYEPRYTEMALACTSGQGGRPLWVMVLGRPKGLPATP